MKPRPDPVRTREVARIMISVIRSNPRYGAHAAVADRRAVKGRM
jgi:hypothetical protein